MLLPRTYYARLSFHIELARPVFHPGEQHRLYIDFPFEPHPHCTYTLRLLGASEKDVGVRMHKLWEAKCQHRESLSHFPLLASHPPHQIFWGPSLQISRRTPYPRRCAVLDKRGVLPPQCRSFRAGLLTPVVTIACTAVLVGPPVVGEMGG